LLWRWKDHIDRKFMNQFDGLPQMEVDLPLRVADGVKDALGDGPLCGGCGAKVGRGPLQSALADLPVTTRNDVKSLPGDDAAILEMGGVRQVLTTDHLSAVTDDPVMMARIATMHALGDIWSMGAAPQAAVLSLTLPRMTAQLQRRTVGEITKTVAKILDGFGAALVGGHTTLGADLTVGLSVTGLCETTPVTLAGAKPGDVIVLTKPIGSGTILAADMRRMARGEDVIACHRLMTQPQNVASRLLRYAHAMTDVTGFGLAGHLAGMCDASGVGAQVRLDDVPFMSGALDLAKGGIRSSLYADNRADARVTAPDTAKAALMFDPQTAGGLLAVLPKAAIDDIVHLHPELPFTIIGDITDTSGVTFS